MAQPSFLSNGTTPLFTDSKWFLWARILGKYQNEAGAQPHNNPKPTDTVWQLKLKLNRSLAGL